MYTFPLNQTLYFSRLFRDFRGTTFKVRCRTSTRTRFGRAETYYSTVNGTATSPPPVHQSTSPPHKNPIQFIQHIPNARTLLYVVRVLVSIRRAEIPLFNASPGISTALHTPFTGFGALRCVNRVMPTRTVAISIAGSTDLAIDTLNSPVKGVCSM